MKSTYTDVHDINQTEQIVHEQLPEDLRALCDSGKSVTELAHLAKNIIQMVSGSVEIMELGLQHKQYDRVLRSWNIFEPNFCRLKKFVLDLIKYTKHYPLRKTECDFNQTVRKGICLSERFLKNKHVKIQLHQDKNIPAVWLDTDRLEEIVLNLIIHAFDNLDDKAADITVRTKYLAGNKQVQLTVSDNGPALTDTLKKQLTEPFERTRNMAGTGFDIPLCKFYVQQHNGYVEIDSDESTGNSVTVYLPIQ